MRLLWSTISESSWANPERETERLDGTREGVDDEKRTFREFSRREDPRATLGTEPATYNIKLDMDDWASCSLYCPRLDANRVAI